MLDLVQTALLKKFKSNELASLYLLSYNSETTNPITWAEQFQKELTPLADHPDILKLTKGEKVSEYKVDSNAIKELLAFISTRPLQLSKKFIFLLDAEALSVIVSNKLLKIFEELGSDYCLILFAPRNTSLLETVLSRAVKLTLPEPAEIQIPEEIHDWSALTSPQELIALLKGSDHELEAEKKFIEHTIAVCLKKKDFNATSALLNALKDYELRSTFNNSKLSRLTSFFP